MRIKMDITNIKQTKQLAQAFAKALKVGLIVLLKGDLGAGKTKFVKEVVAALGGKDLVTSPTFTLLNNYEADIPIYHFDMYRLSSYEEAMAVGFDEYFDKSRLDGICFVEWPENVEGLIKEVDFVVEIFKESDLKRTFIIKEGAHVGD